MAVIKEIVISISLSVMLVSLFLFPFVLAHFIFLVLTR